MQLLSFEGYVLFSLKNKWGTSDDLEETELARRQAFITNFIPSVHSKLKVLTQSYQVSIFTYVS